MDQNHRNWREGCTAPYKHRLSELKTQTDLDDAIRVAHAKIQQAHVEWYGVMRWYTALTAEAALRANVEQGDCDA